MKLSLLLVLLVTIWCSQTSSSPINTTETAEGNQEEIYSEEIELLLLPTHFLTADSPSKLLSTTNNNSTNTKPTTSEDNPKAIQKRSATQPQHAENNKQNKQEQHDLEHAEGNIAFPPKFAKAGRRIERSVVTKKEDGDVGNEHTTIEEQTDGMEETEGQESSLVFRPTFSKRN